MREYILACLLVFMSNEVSIAEEVKFYHATCKAEILEFVDASNSSDEDSRGFKLLMCLANAKYVAIDQNTMPAFLTDKAHYQVFPVSKSIQYSVGKREPTSVAESSNCSCSASTPLYGGGMVGVGPSPKYEAPTSFAITFDATDLAELSSENFESSMAAMPNMYVLSTQPPFELGQKLSLFMESDNQAAAVKSSTCSCRDYSAALWAAEKAETGGATKFELPDNFYLINLTTDLSNLLNE